MQTDFERMGKRYACGRHLRGDGRRLSNEAENIEVGQCIEQGSKKPACHVAEGRQDLGSSKKYFREHGEVPPRSETNVHAVSGTGPQSADGGNQEGAAASDSLHTNRRPPIGAVPVDLAGGHQL